MVSFMQVFCSEKETWFYLKGKGPLYNFGTTSKNYEENESDGIKYYKHNTAEKILQLGSNPHYDTICLVKPNQLTSLTLKTGYQYTLNEQVEMISCGARHTMVLDSNHHVWVIGSNSEGELGFLKRTRPQEQFTKLSSKEFNSVHCGEEFSVLLDMEGNLYSCGSNKFGKLGKNISDDFVDNIEEKLKNIPKIKQLSCGEDHVLCLDYDGNVWSFGCGINGRLGHGDCNFRRSPQKIRSFNENILKVVCGGKYSICIDTQNSIWCFGTNYCGQLGLGDYLIRILPERNEMLQDIVDVSCGTLHTIAVNSLGIIWGFGCNEDGQLGFVEHNNIYSPAELPGSFNSLLSFRFHGKSARK